MFMSNYSVIDYYEDLCKDAKEKGKYMSIKDNIKKELFSRITEEEKRINNSISMHQYNDFIIPSDYEKGALCELENEQKFLSKLLEFVRSI